MTVFEGVHPVINNKMFLFLTYEMLLSNKKTVFDHLLRCTIIMLNYTGLKLSGMVS